MFYWVVNILLQKICRPQNFKKLDEKNNVTNRGSSPHGQRTEIGRTEDTRKTCLVSSKHLVYVQFPFSVQWVTTPSNIYYLDLCEDRYGFLPLNISTKTIHYRRFAGFETSLCINCWCFRKWFYQKIFKTESSQWQ